MNMHLTEPELAEMESISPELKTFVTISNNEFSVETFVAENCFYDVCWLIEKRVSRERIYKFVCECILNSIDEIKPYCPVNVIKWLSNWAKCDYGLHETSRAVAMVSMGIRMRAERNNASQTAIQVTYGLVGTACFANDINAIQTRALLYIAGKLISNQQRDDAVKSMLINIEDNVK